jgi:hypothetical protein
MMLKAMRYVEQVRSCGRVVGSHGRVVVCVVQLCSGRWSIVMSQRARHGGKLGAYLHDDLFS